MLKHYHRNVKLIMVSRGLRAFAFSYLNVVFAIYLNRIGYSTIVIGPVHSVAYVSGAILTAVWGFFIGSLWPKKNSHLLLVLLFCRALLFGGTDHRALHRGS